MQFVNKSVLEAYLMTPVQFYLLLPNSLSKKQTKKPLNFEKIKMPSKTHKTVPWSHVNTTMMHLLKYSPFSLFILILGLKLLRHLKLQTWNSVLNTERQPMISP